MSAIDAAITLAKAETERPSLIVCRTVIGAGAPHKQGTSDVHGAPLGEAEIAAAREAIGWPYGPFEIPDEIYAQWDARAAGREREAAWFERFEAYRRVYPELADEFERRVAGLLPLLKKGDFIYVTGRVQAERRDYFRIDRVEELRRQETRP